jgi:2-polyprenyl-3-methyl-5-hydroxy-6-metoxy-1,4-benzoquinol methylase
MFLLQCFHELHQIDPGYRLFFGGPFEDDGVLEQYLTYMINELNLDGSVSFDGYQDDVPAWLEDKHFLVSAAIGEGHPVNVIEGMACGVKPVIHTWPGARDLFPQELLFRTPEEFCRRIHDDPYEPIEYRRYVKSEYSLAGQLGQLNDLLMRFEASLDSRRKTAGVDTSASCGDRAYGTAESREECVDDVKYYDKRWDDTGATENTFERTRREKVIEAVQGLKRTDLRIVNLGCGRGIIEPHLCEFGRVVGVDFSRTGIRLAQRASPKGTFICSDFFHVALPPRAYDVVVSVEVIEHLEDDDQARYLDLAYDLLAPGGMLVLTTPNRPQMAKLNEVHLAKTGRAWSDQPIENWRSTDEIRDRVVHAGFRVRTVETFLSWEELGELHLYVVAEKPDCHDGHDLKAT